MKALIVNGYAHQVLNNGKIISAKVDGFTPIEEFKERVPAEMNLAGGQVSIMMHMLLQLNNVLQNNQVLPSQKKIEKKERDPLAVVG